jgi:hypothetical protein
MHLCRGTDVEAGKDRIGRMADKICCLSGLKQCAIPCVFVALI